ncbi:hypothetical protein ACODM8_14785 [Vibrio ostreicida]|uniref:Uncharacterized protein n=1 Tax=Vibrio ostreicida TaxID=526588 RepID=A0ABT8C0L2_9VIBR|nr:hypothetical protein [Vibrio ostreicida]MDN3612504.1 hypothetical protein [Vibrio ostreicida]NPD09131.1 hypothetical protein [Vibrio ostreicida]
MFRIKYHLHHSETSWSATIHQLNSDVLKRHILPRVNTHFFDLDFSYCESSSTGEIKDSQGLILGYFYIQSEKESHLEKEA